MIWGGGWRDIHVSEICQVDGHLIYSYDHSVITAKYERNIKLGELKDLPGMTRAKMHEMGGDYQMEYIIWAMTGLGLGQFPPAQSWIIMIACKTIHSKP